MQEEQKQKLLDYVEGLMNLQEKINFPVGVVISSEEDVAIVCEILQQAGFVFIEPDNKKLKEMLSMSANVAIVVKEGKYLLTMNDVEGNNFKSRAILIFSQEEYEKSVGIQEMATSYCNLI